MKVIIEDLKNTITDFFKTDLQIINWDHKRSVNQWSKKEIIGHLIDSAQINLQRFVRCTYEENFKLIYDQDQWVKIQHYQDADIDELLSLWELLNLQIINVLKYYPPDRLNAQCDNGKKEVNLHNVKWLMLDYVHHLKHHLQQVNQEVKDQ